MDENQMDENRIGQKQDWTKALDQNRLDENRLDENWAHVPHLCNTKIQNHVIYKNPYILCKKKSKYNGVSQTFCSYSIYTEK